MGINPPPKYPKPDPPISPPPPLFKGVRVETTVKEVAKEPDYIGWLIVAKMFGL